MSSTTKQKVVKIPVTEMTSVTDLYGKQNLGETTLFAGGFINFGYWENLKITPKISVKTRALSSKKLYLKILSLLSIQRNDTVLEIGCGLGNGCILTKKKYEPKYVIGVDSSHSQIRRAHQAHTAILQGHKDSIKFLVSEAENIKVQELSITKAFSIEAAQHFASIDDFLKSVHKALKPGGKLVVATFFFKKKPNKSFFNAFPNFAKGVDHVIEVRDFTEKLKKFGFEEIQSQSIGKYVWAGFDRWISQTEYRDTWDKNWILAYEDELLDYYIFEASKPNRSQNG